MQPPRAELPRPAQRVGGYVLGVTLGEGSYGRVVLSTHEAKGNVVAIKIIPKEHIRKTNTMRRVEREIALLRTLNHPCVNRLFDNFEDSENIYMVLEYVDGGDLLKALRRYTGTAMPPNLAFKIFYEIVSGLQICHKCCICHRDIKPENILLDSQSNAKLADFGLANITTDEDRKSRLLETSCGSPHYCAPEIIKAVKYDGVKADMWSIGVVLFGLFAGRLPFVDANTQRLLHKVVSGKYDMSSRFDEDLKSLVEGLLNPEPAARLSCEAIHLHPFWIKNCKNYGFDPRGKHSLNPGGPSIPPIVRIPPAGNAKEYPVNETLLLVDASKIESVDELVNVASSLQVFINKVQFDGFSKVRKQVHERIVPTFDYDKLQEPIVGPLDEDVLDSVMRTQRCFGREVLIKSLRSDSYNLEKALYKLLLREVQMNGRDSLKWTKGTAPTVKRPELLKQRSTGDMDKVTISGTSGPLTPKEKHSLFAVFKRKETKPTKVSPSLISNDRVQNIFHSKKGSEQSLV